MAGHIQHDWLSAMPQMLADSVNILDLRAPLPEYDKNPTGLNPERWDAFTSGKLSVGIFAL